MTRKASTSTSKYFRTFLNKTRIRFLRWKNKKCRASIISYGKWIQFSLKINGSHEQCFPDSDIAKRIILKRTKFCFSHRTSNSVKSAPHSTFKLLGFSSDWSLVNLLSGKLLVVQILASLCQAIHAKFVSQFRIIDRFVAPSPSEPVEWKFMILHGELPTSHCIYGAGDNFSASTISRRQRGVKWR